MFGATSAAPSIWNESPSHDSKISSDFYEQLLGWQTTNIDMGPMGTYTMFRQTSASAGGIIPLSGYRLRRKATRSRLSRLLNPIVKRSL